MDPKALQDLVNRTMMRYMNKTKVSKDWVEFILTYIHKEELYRRKNYNCTDDFCIYRLDFISKVEQRRRRDVESSENINNYVNNSSTTSTPESNNNNNNNQNIIKSEINNEISTRTSLLSTTEDDGIKQEMTSNDNLSTVTETVSHSTMESTPSSSTITMSSSSSSSSSTSTSTSSSISSSSSSSGNSIESTYSQIKSSTMSQPSEHQMGYQIRRNCTSKEWDLCDNSVNCHYINVLSKIICECKPGFMGSECHIFDLPVTIKTLSPYQHQPLTADNPLFPQSVIEATAHYTLNAYSEEIEEEN